jgi:Malectin domain
MAFAATRAQDERAELDAVLSSGIFNRAPNLANFLIYVCERYFEGDSDSVKEYSIAVEALRRSADFDQRKDSIVRVEAHRLRKRLAEYYKDDGSEHPIQIEIPNGQYAPQFVARSSSLGEQSPKPLVSEAPPIPVEPVVEQVRNPARKYLQVGLLSLALVSVFVTVFAIWRPHSVAAVSTAENWGGSYSEPVPNEFRFLAGYHGPPFTDRQGRVWQPDAYFEGGVSIPISTDLPIDGLPDPKFVRSRREGAFSYAIPARQGTYELHLHFIGLSPRDPFDPSSGSLFRVLVNNKVVLDSFDPISDAGGFDRLHSRVIRDVSPSNDGKIHLSFQPLSSKGFVSAVEVLSSEPGRVRPVRIVAAKSSVIDSNGLVWTADEDARGGFLVERKDSIQDPRLRMLFAGEHYGNFTYHIPVPPGRYRVKLYFAETYFGSKLPAASSAEGARLFNVFANGLVLLRDFDVAKTAGDINRATIKEFENIEPNAQGNIVFEFVPTRNYAEVNAIEVSQMN